MEREWRDELGRVWHVGLDEPGATENGDVVVVFTGEGEEDRSLPGLGPWDELFEKLGDGAIQQALDAAASGRGILLLEADGHLWWVRGPEDDLLGGAWTVKFGDGTTEHTHRGRIPDRPEELSEDELLELLDEARGSVMEEMDVTGGG